MGCVRQFSGDLGLFQLTGAVVARNVEFIGEDLSPVPVRVQKP